MSTTHVFDQEVQQADWDGIPVFWAEAPEPFLGALVFRVGRADESLKSGGLTHLVEHLALSPFGRGTYEYNGRVESAITSFYASGSADEVIPHLRTVAEALEELPLDQLEHEKRILSAEANTAAGSLDARLMALRFGPVGYGLVNHAELGLGWVSAEDVAAWARERFTKENAAIWLTGPPPEGLEALSLPRGQATPPPVPEPIPSLELPSHLAEGTGGVALSFVAERSGAVHAAFMIAVERAHTSLRKGAAVSYAPGGSYYALDGEHAHVVVSADCKDQDAPEVQDKLLSIVQELAENGPTSEELAWDRTMVERAMRDPYWAPPSLDSQARDKLLGAEPQSRSNLLQEREELTSAKIAEATATMMGSLLMLVPTGVAKPTRPPLSTFAPEYKEQVEGKRHPVTSEWEQWGELSEIVVGEQGFSYVRKDGSSFMSWRFEDCIAGVRQLSGAITVIGRDGSWVTVYPHRYLAGGNAVAQIAQALGEERLVPISNRARELSPIVEDQLGNRVGRVAQEVDSLEDVLGGGEEVRVLAEARRGKQIGLLGLTDRRLVFMFLGTHERELFEKALAAVSSAAAKGVLKKKLVVDHDEGSVEFEDVKPDSRPAEIAQLLSQS